MKKCTQFDNRLIHALHEQVKHIQPSENLFENINDDIKRKQAVYSMNTTLKKTSFRKIAVICALCITLVSGVAYAASQATSLVSHSGRIYDTLPTIEQVQADTGFAAKYVAAFNNGYKFVDGSLGETDGLDEQDNKVASEKFVNFFYALNSTDKTRSVSLDISPVTVGIDGENPNAEILVVDDVQFTYSKQHYKFVPVDYQMTAVDEQAIQEGTLEISFGSEGVEEQDIQSLSWMDNGLNYSLIDMYSNLTQAELLEMAKEVIAQK